ncbi:MAG: transposase [Candidatus Woesebacteria bacterium]|nr:transposase [Candidatus Woesebacteria bacterium]
MLRKGMYDDVSLAGWGHLDELMAMTMGLGIYNVLEGIKPQIKGACYIPRLVIYNALYFKHLLGEASYLSLQEGLFKDPGLLQLMGCTARVVREGFDRSRNKGERKPFHVDSIRHFQESIPEEELEKAWPQTVRPIARALKGKKGVFILDATKQLVYGDYEGVGEQTLVKEVLRQDGTEVQTKIKEKGFKDATLCLLRRGELIVVAYRKIPIRQHESTVAAELVEEGQRTLGEDSPDVILVDRGFISGPLFADWKKKGLDVVVPLRRNMNLLKDMQGLAKLGDGLEVRLKDDKGKQTVIKAFSNLTSLDSYPGKLSGLLVTQYRGISKAPLEQWGFLTTLDIHTRKQALTIYRNYDDRSLIENKGYRELKQGFNLARYPGLSSRAQALHLFFMLLAFNLVALWRSGGGERYADMGIRRLRRKALTTPDQVIVYVGRSYDIMSLSEFVTHLGRPPSGKLDDVVKILSPSRRYTFSLNKDR